MRRFEDLPFHEKQRRRLVNALQDKGIKDQRVLEVMYDIPRHFFMEPDQEEVAYEDKAFPIGEGQTISQPYTVAYQTSLLEVKRSDRVLEIGTGSAYQAVILAELAAEVYSIERLGRLYERNINFTFLRMFRNLHLFYGDGFEGLPQYAPFDKILITAAAPFIPERLVAQLKRGGIMVLPLGKEYPQRMVRIIRNQHDQLRQEFFDNFSFVPMLRGKED